DARVRVQETTVAQRTKHPHPRVTIVAKRTATIAPLHPLPRKRERKKLGSSPANLCRGSLVGNRPQARVFQHQQLDAPASEIHPDLGGLAAPLEFAHYPAPERRMHHVEAD